MSTRSKRWVRLIKVLHELSSSGFIGAVAAQLILVMSARGASPEAFAAARANIEIITRWLLVPSLVVVLLSGLASIAVFGPYRNALWAWTKAFLGMPVLFCTMGVLRNGAREALDLANLAVAGHPHAEELAELLRREWAGLWTVLVLSVVNLVLAIWRPRFVVKAG